MTKRIFYSVSFASIGVFLATVVLFLGVLYQYFSGVQKAQLNTQTELAAQGAALNGLAYLEGLKADDCRITWIDDKGKVLYDNKSDADKMENHLQREEVQEALAGGNGESARYSSTLLVRSLYCAKRMPDGTVIRLSVEQNTILTLLIGMSQPICVIVVFAFILSLVLASHLSKKIVRPLNELKLDDPPDQDYYDELAPLIRRIRLQQQQIKQKSSALLQKQHEFEIVTNGMTEGIILLNGDQMILSINPAARRILCADSSCVGQWIPSVNRRPELQQLLLKAGDGKYAEKVMEINQNKYQVGASPVLSGGKVSGMVLLLLDVTEKEKAEQMRREFTANVSHELKTPLHTISGCAELMANGMVQQEDMKKFSAQIYTEAQRMICLVEDIIKLSRLDEGAEDMKWEETDLYALAEKTIESILPEAEAADIKITLEGEKAVLRGVPQLLQGIVYNLCDNAVKYNNRGGSVAVSVKKEAKSVRLTVSDTGIGILPKHQERIFERFYRVDKSHSREIGGTGLGLSIVKHAAKLHHAAIMLESRPGEGTAISVTFPA